ncbi:MAG: hypothetical protein QNJ32_28565 [Xenococcaceae cyanobacterium MO_167.B27]|nr:hypothetical protein [Xenococcaceae cyanobacterium MO_167.B27]
MHQSCLLITSREKIPGLSQWEGNYLPVRCWQLKGLSKAAGKKIFATKGDFIALEAQWQTLSDRYGGNPLALKIAASAIKDFFASDITSFLEILAQSSFMLDDIQNLLEQQFRRLSDVQKEIMYWLAIEREPVSFRELKTNFINRIPPQKIVQGLTYIQVRSLLYKKASKFSQQPVIMEFIVNNLIEQIYQEIITKKIDVLNKVSLVQAQAKDYIREAQ